MPENKTIHDLPIAEQTNASDVFETEIPSQLMQSGYASRKVTMSSLETHMLGTEQYETQLSNFPQGSRSIFSALEYARQSGGGGGASANEAEPYDEDENYVIGNYCIENNYLWRCIADTTGTFDATKWIAVLVTDEYKRVRVMHKADFDLLTPEEQADGMIFVDDVDITASDISYDNTVSGLSASDLQEAVDELDGKLDNLNGLVKVVFSGNISKTLTANQNLGILGTEIIPAANMPSGYTVIGLLSSYSTNNSCIMYSYDASAVGTSGTFCFIKNNTASSQNITVNYRILFMKSAYVS